MQALRRDNLIILKFSAFHVQIKAYPTTNVSPFSSYSIILILVQLYPTKETFEFDTSTKMILKSGRNVLSGRQLHFFIPLRLSCAFFIPLRLSCAFFIPLRFSCAFSYRYGSAVLFHTVTAQLFFFIPLRLSRAFSQLLRLSCAFSYRYG